MNIGDGYRRDHFHYVLTAIAAHLNFSLCTLARLHRRSPALPIVPPPPLAYSVAIAAARSPAYAAPLARCRRTTIVVAPL
jgi:hypothetical protein